MLLPLLPQRPAPEITVRSILESSNVWDLSSPQRFRLKQDSSYDRRSLRPATLDWFANEDWGHYLREETNEGRHEWVLADLRGPGAMVRQWSANPVGTWRYYFDGEATPRLTTTGRQIAAGRWLGFDHPYTYVASRGCNLYFPFPYAKSLKVTVDVSDGDPKSMYYVLGHRTYPDGTPLRSMVPEDRRFAGNFDIVGSYFPPGPPARVRRPGTRPTAPVAPPPPEAPLPPINDHRVVVAPGASADLLVFNEGGRFSPLELQVSSPLPSVSARPGDSMRSHHVLRHLVLEADFDGERAISAPFSDLFGSPPDAEPYTSAVASVGRDGRFLLKLPISFRRAARLRVRNLGMLAVPIRARTRFVPGDPGPGNLLLHAQFKSHPGGSRPMRDMPVAHLQGRGHYIGTVLHVVNPSRAWWGEGDEKVRVDGEAFPSIFGTGTEDYFGYAWSSNVPFSRPYHAQPRADPDGNSGQIANVRWHVLDPIPYTKSLDFDLEQWHWAETRSRFATTAFWYAAPGGTPATPLKAADLVVPDGTPPGPEPGAFQGEALEIAERTGGATEIQSGFADLADAQLWWRDAALNDRLTLRLPEVPAGRYRIEARFCTAKDYGRHELVLDGNPLGTRDFYAPNLGWKRLGLGEVDLRGGRPTLTVLARRPNPRAEPRNMFALDWIKLVRIH